MFNFFESLRKAPILKNLGLKRYQIAYSIERLVLGVDNIRFDVHISPQVYSALKKTAFLLMIKHSRSEMFFKDYKRDSCEIEKDTLRRICNDVILDGINRAKSANEVQIDFLGQTAFVKLFLEEIDVQYNNVIAQIEPLIRIYQLSDKYDQNDIFVIKDRLADIRLHHNQIIRLVRKELFELLAEINSRKLKNMRETHFSLDNILPDYFFTNPILQANNPNNDFFLIEEYVLMGQRSEDLDNYNSIKSIIYELLGQTDLGFRNIENDNERNDQKDMFLFSPRDNIFDPWIMEPDNIDRMLDCFNTQGIFKKAKKEKQPEDVLEKIREQMQAQQSLLNLFYHKFKKSQLIRQVIADFEMKSIYETYCPPLAPRQIREFLVNFWSRIAIITKQKRLKSLYGEELNIKPLLQTVKRIKGSTSKEKKQYLIMFLKQFSRYHRDLYNFHIIKDAMDSINLLTEEKIVLLSRENRSLFEFLLPDERVKEETPITNHVIMKADIRGSVIINHTMRDRGLNPASYFSLNFFDPISAVLFEYNASKEFIEGDAIILSIFENEDTSQSSYSVARACGLAIRILQIVNQYNEKNKENNLPILELGVGICYSQGPPSFLFDGDSRIMISPAINLADRLSSCDKKLHSHLKNQVSLFNLFVFKNAAEDESEDSANDYTLRYNVNGIELSEDSYNKLAKEINLKTVLYPAENNENIRLYSGKVPMANGNYQRIVIREAAINIINPETLNVTGETSRKYYEVCTHQKIYDFIDNQS